MNTASPSATIAARTRATTLLAALLAVSAQVTGFAAAQPEATTWYVRAGAAAGGTGSADAPFDSLGGVEAVSRDGDTIIVQPSAVTLDGGIALKPGQQLVGAGPAVVGAADTAALPRISNNTLGHDGDAVRLAPGAQVRNLVITGAWRGGIYGSDAADVVISGNDVSGTNRLCSDGFLIGPFGVPPTIPLGTAIAALPDFLTLNNGWAAIMTDFQTAAGTVRIEGNAVHDTACGDGIDLRAHGGSRIDADVNGNTLRAINLGVAKLSVLALGVQAGDNAVLTGRLNGNSENDIATLATGVLNATADSEGVFINPSGRARLDIAMDANHFHNGGGNFSANGLEYVTTNGAPESRVRVTDSVFDTVTGDVIENYNLSTGGAHQSLTLENVYAHHSSFPGAVLNSLVPANLGTCVVTTNFGRAAHTDLTIANSDLGDCSADGIGLIAYTPAGSEPSTAALTFDIRDTVVGASAANGVDIMNIGDTATLRGAITRTAIASARESLLRTSISDGPIADAAVTLHDLTLDGVATGCDAIEHDGRVVLSGLPVGC
ncbi:hypothetical protein D7D52_30430 [Nocardia yunnanensis]|uniref:Right-handed parallel beta-helix repeat-containing protein n=1 Tax=Nocardia yunnanensis TaxID=2382165 RepID=A0A386ZLB3_9NOCA|nr:hypothetical protein [Nocardia yunnanensis]AYF77419.1 hypothetical protein D7D52_30430 [Nocardia yunnanensis]